MDISVVVPLYNEEESLPELSAWIEKVMTTNNFTYEIIMVDDGSNDKSWKVIEQLSAKDNQLREISRITLWFRGCTRRRGNHHGCRLAG